MEEILYITDRGEDELYQALAKRLEGICRLETCTVEAASERQDLGKIIILPYFGRLPETPACQALVRRLLSLFNLDDYYEYRVYVIRRGMSEAEFRSLLTGNDADRQLGELGDVIQIEGINDPEVLTEDIRGVIGGREKIRRERRHLEVVNNARIAVGRLALVLMVLCIVCELLYVSAFCLSVGFLKEWADRLGSVLQPAKPFLDILGIIGGGASFVALLTVLLSFFRNGFESFALEWDRMNSGETLPVIVMLVFVGSFAAHADACVSDGHWPLLILGVAVGFLLDYLRRLRHQGLKYRRFVWLDKSMRTAEGRPLSRKLMISGRRPLTRALTVPYLRKKRTSLFVSYTHTSPWSVSRAEEIFELCRRAGVDCFVDSKGIPLGSSWRRAILMNLVDADYFVSIADDRSMKKQWPAAEIEMALELRYFTFLPEIICMVPEELNLNALVKDTLDKLTPVFREVLICRGEPDFFVRTIRYSENALDTLIAWGIARNEANKVFAVWNRSPVKGDRAAEKQIIADWVVMHGKLGHMATKCNYSEANLSGDAGIGILDSDYESLSAKKEICSFAESTLEQGSPTDIVLACKDAVSACRYTGDIRGMIRFLLISRDVVYGSLLSNYESLIDLHVNDGILAKLFERTGDRERAVKYAASCINELNAVEALQMHVLANYGDPNSKASATSKSFKDLPLEYKLKSDSSNFVKIKEDAAKICRKYS